MLNKWDRAASPPWFRQCGGSRWVKRSSSYLQTWRKIIAKLPPLSATLQELLCQGQNGGQRGLLSRQSSVELQETHWKTPTGPLQPPKPPGTGWPSSSCPCLSRAPPDTDCPAGHRAEPPHQGHVPAVVPPKPPL